MTDKERLTSSYSNPIQRQQSRYKSVPTVFVARVNLRAGQVKRNHGQKRWVSLF